MVPGKKGATRWIVPESSEYGLVALKEWHPFGLFSRLKWRVFKALYVLKLLGIVPGMKGVRVFLPEESDWKHLGWEEKSSPVPVIYVGTPCGAQKLTVFLVDSEKKQVERVVKIPLASGAIKNVLHEAFMLEQLEFLYPESLAPKVVCQDKLKGRVTQSHLKGDLMGFGFTSAHRKFLVLMEQKGDGSNVQETTLEIRVNMLSERIRQVADRAFGYEAKRGFIEKALLWMKDKKALSVCCAHGDFAPWNLKRSKTGRLVAFDWESGTLTGLPLQDLFHFFWIQNYLFAKNKDVFEWALADPEVCLYLDYFGIDRALAEKLYGYYLLEYWCRRLEEGSASDAEEVYTSFASDLSRHIIGVSV